MRLVYAFHWMAHKLTDCCGICDKSVVVYLPFYSLVMFYVHGIASSFIEFSFIVHFDR